MEVIAIGLAAFATGMLLWSLPNLSDIANELKRIADQLEKLK